MPFEFALTKLTNRLVHVDSVLNGIECNCVCPDCGKDVVACNGGQRLLTSYFRHAKWTTCRGDKGYAHLETLHHESLKKAIKHSKRIPKEPILNRVNTQLMLNYSKDFSSINLRECEEEFVIRNPKNISPLKVVVDVFAFSGKHAIAIEVCFTHKSTYEKRKLLEKFGISMIEIEINKRKLPDEKFIQELRRDKDWQRIAELYLPNANIRIPSEWSCAERANRFKENVEYDLPKDNISGHWHIVLKPTILKER